MYNILFCCKEIPIQTLIRYINCSWYYINFNYDNIALSLTGDRLTVFVLDHSGSWIRLSDFRFVVRVAASGHVGNAVRRVKHRSVAGRRWGWITPLRLGVLFVEKLRRDVRERLMGHSHITFSNVQRFHELLWCPMQIFQRDLREKIKRVQS